MLMLGNSNAKEFLMTETEIKMLFSEIMKFCILSLVPNFSKIKIFLSTFSEIKFVSM